MPDTDLLAAAFEEHRAHLRAVAYRLLGSLTDAEDAVQEAWLRLSKSDASEVDSLGAWLRQMEDCGGLPGDRIIR